MNVQQFQAGSPCIRQSAQTAQTAQTAQCQQSQSACGQSADKLYQKLGQLEAQEITIRQRMQDRMKFMSAKNAYQCDGQLAQIEAQKQQIATQIRTMQG